MKLRILLSFLLMALGWSTQTAASDLSDDEVFRALEGSWKGTGQLVNREGEKTPIEEDWTGEFIDGNRFLMSGTRQWGEDTHQFRWEFSYNPTTELYECLYEHSGMEEPLRFEVSRSENQVEMRAPFGDPGGELRIRNQLREPGVRGTVEAVGADGVTQLEGVIVHRKKE